MVESNDDDGEGVGVGVGVGSGTRMFGALDVNATMLPSNAIAGLRLVPLGDVPDGVSETIVVSPVCVSTLKTSVCLFVSPGVMFGLIDFYATQRPPSEMAGSELPNAGRPLRSTEATLVVPLAASHRSTIGCVDVLRSALVEAGGV